MVAWFEVPPGIHVEGSCILGGTATTRTVTICVTHVIIIIIVVVVTGPSFVVLLSTLPVNVASDDKSAGRNVEGSGRRLVEAPIHAVDQIE